VHAQEVQAEVCLKEVSDPTDGPLVNIGIWTPKGNF
jgi:hypothetical protein